MADYGRYTLVFAAMMLAWMVLLVIGILILNLLLIVLGIACFVGMFVFLYWALKNVVKGRIYMGTGRKNGAQSSETVYRRDPPATDPGTKLAQQPGSEMEECAVCAQSFPRAEMKQVVRRVSIVDMKTGIHVKGIVDANTGTLKDSMMFHLSLCPSCFETKEREARERGAREEAITESPQVPGIMQSDEDLEKITYAAVLGSMPEGEYMRIDDIIKALNITDITGARFLEIKLKTLVNQGRIERKLQDGKNVFKKSGIK